MKIRRLRRSTVVDATPAELFAFHADPANLRAVSPPTTRVRSIRAEPVARVGAAFEVRLAEFGILPIRWVGRWVRVEAPGCLVDELVEGPFLLWRHTHRFLGESDTRTRLVDEVEFRWRREPWASWIEGRLIRPLLGAFFAVRHARTRRHFQRRRRAGAPGSGISSGSPPHREFNRGCG